MASSISCEQYSTSQIRTFSIWSISATSGPWMAIAIEL